MNRSCEHDSVRKFLNRFLKNSRSSVKNEFWVMWGSKFSSLSYHLSGGGFSRQRHERIWRNHSWHRTSYERVDRGGWLQRLWSNDRRVVVVEPIRLWQGRVYQWTRWKHIVRMDKDSSSEVLEIKFTSFVFIFQKKKRSHLDDFVRSWRSIGQRKEISNRIFTGRNRVCGQSVLTWNQYLSRRRRSGEGHDESFTTQTALEKTDL